MKKLLVLAVLVALFLLIAPVAKVNAASLSDNVVIRLAGNHSESRIEINVNMLTNTGVSAMTLELVYDKTVFEFEYYERGSALEELDLISTDLSADPSLPVKFNWMSQNVENDFSTGTMLRLYFKLKEGVPAGRYEIGFKSNDKGDVVYIENDTPNSKSAIIAKAVVNIAENKITEIEIESDQSQETPNLALLITSISLAVVAIGALVTILIVRKKRDERRRKENWLKI